MSKNIIVKSVNGAKKTIVNGSYSHRCFYLYVANPTIDGFTITNGYVSKYDTGGGIYCDRGGIIQNCIISGNSAWDGGGVSCYFGGIVQNCTISENSASNWAGGVLCNRGGIIQNCIICSNSANIGSGVCCNKGCIVQNCVISENLAMETGGVLCWGGTIQDCTIIRNLAAYFGGVECRDDGIVQNCTIIGNVASNYGGGGMSSLGGTIQNCTITGNSADNGGGLLSSFGGTIQNCTIIGNYAVNGGGVLGYSDSTIQNCIVWNNTNGNHFFSGSTNFYNCIENWTNLVNGIITNNPEFIDAAAGNYRLESFSPCINAGTNMSWMWTATDLDGNPRIIGGTVDMGAYEFVPEPIMGIWIVGMLGIWIVGITKRHLTKA